LRFSLRRETAGEYARHTGQNLPQCLRQDSRKIRSAQQDALNFDARAESGSFRARMHDEPEKIAVVDFEVNDIARGKRERRRDTDARVRNVGDLAVARPGGLSQLGDVHVKVGHVARVETAIHIEVIGRFYSIR
jgi:hypothetical protein